MIMFSKSVSREYTKFLFCLTVFLSFTASCSAESTPKESEKVVKPAVNSSKTTAEIAKISSEKTAEKVTSEKKASPEKVAEKVSSEKAVSESEEKTLLEKREIPSEKKPEDNVSEKQKSDDSQNKGVISELIETISNAKISDMKKPFKDLPGYWEQVDDLDITIANTETDDEFPSESFSLKSLKGNVVVLFFTTTWCPNCVKVFQDLDNLSREMSNKNISNVKIITLVLGMDDDDTVKQYYENNSIKSLHRFKSLSPAFFNVVRAVPTCFVFNKKSVPVWGFSGATNYGAFEFLNFIEGLSKED